MPHSTSPDNHVRLGDIVVSNRMGVVQYDLGKEKEKTFEHRAPPNPPSARLLEAVQVLERDRLAGKRPWDDHLRAGMAARSMTIPDPSTDVVLDKDKKPIEHPPVSGPIPRVFYSPIASANVVQGNYKKRDKLRDKFKAKAVEMEGSGIADATWEYEKAGYLVVRGVCDYCDDRTKSRQTDAWKPYAAMVAAAYVRALLQTIPGGGTCDIQFACFDIICWRSSAACGCGVRKAKDGHDEQEQPNRLPSRDRRQGRDTPGNPERPERS